MNRTRVSCNNSIVIFVFPGGRGGESSSIGKTITYMKLGICKNPNLRAFRPRQRLVRSYFVIRNELTGFSATPLALTFFFFIKNS